jgi:WD40 repeat protein
VRALACLIASIAAACPSPTGPTTSQPKADAACVRAGQALDEAKRHLEGGYLGRALAGAIGADELCSTERARAAIADVRAALWLDRDLDPSTASESDKKRARLLYRAGQVLRERDGDIDASLARFGESLDAWPHPLTLVQVGRSHEAAGQLVEARTAYARALALAERLTGERAAPRLLRGHLGNIYDVAHHPTLPLLATTGEEHTIKLWDLTSGRIRHTIERAYGFELSFSPDGDIIAAANGDTVELWDTATGAHVRSLPADGASTMAFGPSGELLVSGTLDGVVAVWNVASGALVNSWLASADENSISSVAINGDGSLVASDDDGEIHLWTRDGTAVEVLPRQHGTANAIAFHPTDSSTLATTGDDGALLVWDILSAAPKLEVDVHDGRAYALAYDPTGANVVTGGTDGVVAVSNGSSGARLLTMDHGDQVRTVSFNPDGDEIVSAGMGGMVRFWRADSGEHDRFLDTPGEELRAVEFTAAGELTARSADGGAHSWSTTTGELVRTRESGEAPPLARAISVDSPSGRFTVAASPTGVLVTAGDGSPLADIPIPRRVNSVAFSPDESLVALGLLAEVAIWNTRDWSEHIEVAHGGGVMAEYIHGLAFRPDGRMLASASSNETIALWDVDTWSLVREITAHELSVNAVAFSPDGALLASVSSDNLLKLWSPDTGAHIATIYPTSDRWLLTTPDGRVDGTTGDTSADTLLYWQVGDYQLPGDIGWQRNHTAGLLADLVNP